MKKSIVLGGQNFAYELNIKNVKNINLRIKKDGTISVSANPYVSEKYIEEFVLSKERFILGAIERFKLNKDKVRVQYFNDTEIIEVIENYCKKAYSYYQRFLISYPEIKFRKMTSCWGNCRTGKGILTFNTNLKFAPGECIEYVVLHEFTHFLHPNHSKDFYDELSRVCPDCKEKRRILRDIFI